MRTENVTVGTRIFAQGDHSQEAYRILQGRVEISLNEAEKKVVLGTLAEGEIFGEMGMIEHLPRTGTAEALTDVTLEVIAEDDLNQSLLGGNETLTSYLSTIFERLRGVNERLRVAHEQLDRLSAPASSMRLKRRQPMVLSSGSLLLEPDSQETRSQSALQKQVIRSFPFAFGRRADLAACVDVFSKSHTLIGERPPYNVSRSHCVIVREKGAYYIQDRKSKLGTLVNGQLLGLGSEVTRVRLEPGANTLVLGPMNSTIRFILAVPSE